VSSPSQAISTLAIIFHRHYQLQYHLKNIKDDGFSYQLYPLELWDNYLSKAQASQETLLHPFLE
jgi:hypothetical protein